MGSSFNRNVRSYVTYVSDALITSGPSFAKARATARNAKLGASDSFKLVIFHKSTGLNGEFDFFPSSQEAVDKPSGNAVTRVGTDNFRPPELQRTGKVLELSGTARNKTGTAHNMVVHLRENGRGVSKGNACFTWSPSH